MDTIYKWRFNIATGSSINLFELLDQLEKELNVKRVKITYESARSGDIQHSQASCTKYQKLVTNV